MVVPSIASYVSDAVLQLQDQYKENKVATVIATIVLLAAGWIVMSRGMQSTEGSDDTTAQNKSSTSTNQQKSIQPIDPKVSDDGKLRNVFSVKQKPPIPGGAGKKDSSDRPFGSSYYYAHNNSNSKGGYADGLRAEDYVMNGPRLLSKGGVNVKDEPSSSIEESQEQNNSNDTLVSEKKDALDRPKLSTASKKITRYLWDDDGEGDLAKIHIDCLPKTSTETMSWQDASISKDDVEVNLLGKDNDGLMVRITSLDEKRYHLHVPKMYGSADSVKPIVKKHKLLIKITKKKIKKRQASGGLMGSLFGKEEYISVKWPQLSSTGGEIDEKAFKEVDFKDMDKDMDNNLFD